MTGADQRLLQDESRDRRGTTRYLDQDQASEYLEQKGLRVAPKTLGKLRVTGGGPVYRKFGRRRIYDPFDLDTWIDQKLGAPRRSTGETA